MTEQLWHKSCLRVKSISLFTVREWRTDIRAGYDTLVDNLSSFRSVGNEPLPIDINRLDEGDGISNTLTRNHAKWHASCCLKCCANHVARIVQPSPATSETPGGHPYMRRQATRREILLEECKCFFCDEVGTEDAPLHDAMIPKIIVLGYVHSNYKIKS